MLILGSVGARAQKFSIQTNLVDWALMATFNAEASVSFTQHFSLVAGAKFNPWEFSRDNKPAVTLKQTTAYVGFRYWPWYVNSGFWVGSKLQFQEFHMSGLFGRTIDATGGHGIGLSAGYSIMLNESLNLDLGVGGWGGRFQSWMDSASPNESEPRAGSKLFFYPDAISVSFVYVF